MDGRGADSAETAQLLERAREGDPEAANRLFARHREYLLRFVALRLPRKLRARVGASDVIQEAQLEAARRLPAYLKRPGPPFQLWLRQIAQDRLIMAHRRHAGATKRDVDREVPLPEGSSVQLAQDLLGTRGTPSQLLVRKELAQRVQEALAMLPDASREILLMRNFEGLSNNQVAQVLDVDPATSSRHAVLGDKDAALEWLTRAADKGLRVCAAAAPDPDLEILLGAEQRYRALCERMVKR